MIAKTIMGDFDWDRYERLLEAYHSAIEEGSDHFFFDNMDWDMGFTKHMLDYLPSQLKKQ